MAGILRDAEADAEGLVRARSGSTGEYGDPLQVDPDVSTVTGSG